MQIYQITSVYALCGVLFEYPTGVIADYFSPRTSVFLGYLLAAIVIFLMGLSLNFVLYLLLMVLYAVSVALMSGSDTVLISSVSNNFKSDFSKINYISQIWSVVAISLGSLIAKYSFSLTFYLSAVFYFFGAILVFMMSRNLYKKGEGNIFIKAKEGLFYVLKTKELILITIIGLVSGGFFISFKWLYNPLLETLKFDLAIWGVIIALASAFIALGMMLYPKMSKLGYVVPLTICTLAILLTGVTSYWFVALLGLFVLHYFSGYLQTHTDYLINENTPKGYQASSLSFKNMVVRLFSAGYIFIAGYILSDSTFSNLMYSTAIIFIGLLIILVFGRKILK